MPVYVDNVRHAFGRMVMCHMWADTLPELHAMADAIGVARKWFQGTKPGSWDHYDISLSRKAEAIRLGAILTDKYAPLEYTKRQQLAAALADNDTTEIAQAIDWILRIYELRQRVSGETTQR